MIRLQGSEFPVLVVGVCFGDGGVTAAQMAGQAIYCPSWAALRLPTRLRVSGKEIREIPVLGPGAVILEA